VSRQGGGRAVHGPEPQPGLGCGRAGPFGVCQRCLRSDYTSLTRIRIVPGCCLQVATPGDNWMRFAAGTWQPDTACAASWDSGLAKLPGLSTVPG
jgi:hypothetical protein